MGDSKTKRLDEEAAVGGENPLSAEDGEFGAPLEQAAESVIRASSSTAN